MNSLKELPMLRKALFASVASLGLLSPLAVTAPANAHEFEHRHCYHVYYRACCNEPWRCAGEFHSRHRAFHVAHEYRERGFEVSVRS
jgi:hypothetical protein